MEDCGHSSRMQTYGEGTGSKGRKLWSPQFQNLGKETATGNAALECVVPVMPARSGGLGSISCSALVIWGAEKVVLRVPLKSGAPKHHPRGLFCFTTLKVLEKNPIHGKCPVIPAVMYKIGLCHVNPTKPTYCEVFLITVETFSPLGFSVDPHTALGKRDSGSWKTVWLSLSLYEHTSPGSEPLCRLGEHI